MSEFEVVIRTFVSEADANLAQAILAANGIEAIVLRDDAGGMLPSMSLGSDIRLVVRAADAPLARELFEAGDG
jgi:hypothetical protein